jgi:hypothetical protein
MKQRYLAMIDRLAGTTERDAVQPLPRTNLATK